MARVTTTMTMEGNDNADDASRRRRRFVVPRGCVRDCEDDDDDDDSYDRLIRSERKERGSVNGDWKMKSK